MDNKNDKTFADLFSSVSSSDHQENGDSKQVAQVESQGNIFDQQDTLNMNSLLKDDKSKNQESVVEQSEDKKEDAGISFENIFFDINSNESDVKTGNSVFEEGITNLENRNVFEQVEDRRGDHESIDDLRFGQMSEVDLKNTEEKKDSENSSVLSDIHSENPFFQESSQSNARFLNERVDDIFKKNSEVKMENPFFRASLSSEEKKIDSIENTSNVESQEKREKNIELEEPKSISPFFVDNAIESQGDSLGIDKINLIENNQIGKNVGTIDASKSKHFNVKIVKKKEPFIKFILGVVSYAVFILLLLIGITLLVYVLDIKIRAAKGDYSAPKFNAYVVLTGSMLPDIQVKDVVVTKKTDPSKLEVGDVITFASADSRFLNTVITHRIIKKSYDAKSKTYSFQTKGDNNNVADGALVPQNNIFGRVILKIPKLGYLQEFLATDGGWILVILVPCLTVISYDIVKLIKGLKRKKYKNITVQR